MGDVRSGNPVKSTTGGVCGYGREKGSTRPTHLRWFVYPSHALRASPSHALRASERQAKELRERDAYPSQMPLKASELANNRVKQEEEGKSSTQRPQRG